MSGFGEAVRVGREARGWTQQELARRADVSQRAVSSWERGVSEPRDATKRVVAAVLHLPPDVVPPKPGHHELAGTAALSELPFENLAPDEFEDFAVTLAKALYPDAEPHRQGKSGHTQYGFDVVVERDGKVVVGIQCKRVQEFGPREVEKAVAAATMPVGTAMIFLSRAASPDARGTLRAHRRWQLWDKNKLSHAVHELPLDRSVPLVDRYFPLLRESFLGVALPGPWLEPDQYVNRTGGSERYNHQWSLVGQDEILEDLVRFATGPTGWVGMLVGRGGTGKSKMLYELGQRLAGNKMNVRFLERDPVIDHRAFEQLPAGRLLVVLDDAHDEDAPIGKVVTGVLNTNPDARVLLALRPDGEVRSRRQLREAGVDPQPTERWELPDLELADAEALAREVLGPAHTYAAPRLAAAARDCPFLLVTGAILVREGTVDLGHFEGDDHLRREVIESLADAVSSGSTEVRTEVLNAAAALQPLRTADSDFRDTLEELTARAFDQVMPHLSAWEDAGILLRRGQTYRVVPDLLGDALLARAAQARETGAATGYLERVRLAAGGQALANLMVNASRIDWQEPAARRGHLVDSLWEEVTAEFQAGDAAIRVAILGVLVKVAFYQPQPTLTLVRWALEHPAEPAQTQARLGLSYTHTDQEVRDAAAPVLRIAAYDPEILPEAAGLLWELGRSDARPPNQHPNHALRMLAELAGFDRRGVSIYQQSLPAIVERWLRRPRRDTDVHDPLTVLHPLLAAEGHEETWSPHALTFHPFLINPDATPVVELRRAVLDLAFEQLASIDLRRAGAAVETIGSALAGPLGGFGLQVTDQEREPWTTHFASALARLRDAVRAHPLAPAVCVALRARLQWDVEHASSHIHQAACEVLAALPRQPEHELARALHGGPIDPPSNPEVPLGYQDRQRANEQFLTDCAVAVVDLPEVELASLIEQLFDDLHRALSDDGTRAQRFLRIAVTARPSLGEALCTRVQDAPESRLASVIASVVSALAQTGDLRAIDLAHRLLATGDMDLARQVAHGFGSQRCRADLLDGEPALLRTLVAHPDPDGIVSNVALGAVRFLATQHQDLAVELLTSVPAGRKDVAFLNEFTMTFGPGGALSWTDLAQRHKDEFLDALRAAASIDSFEIAQFLAMLSRDDPRSVIDLLTARVADVEGGADLGTYRALPFSWHVPLRFRDHDDFPDLLRRVREWIAAAPGSPWRHYLGSELFSTVAGTFDAQPRQVIEEYLDEPDPTRMKTVATMLRGAPRILVWDADFIRRCLRAADACSEESLSAVQSALHSAVFTGGRWTAVGQPCLRDIEQRDTATRLAEQAVRGSVEERFYRALSQSAESWIDRSRSELNLPLDGRDW
ncbi:MAG: helix-turn-helix domain-containing protein [Pseudonocardiaceae bacterium]